MSPSLMAVWLCFTVFFIFFVCCSLLHHFVVFHLLLTSSSDGTLQAIEWIKNFRKKITCDSCYGSLWTLPSTAPQEQFLLGKIYCQVELGLWTFGWNSKVLPIHQESEAPFSSTDLPEVMQKAASKVEERLWKGSREDGLLWWCVEIQESPWTPAPQWCSRSSSGGISSLPLSAWWACVKKICQDSCEYFVSDDVLFSEVVEAIHGQKRRNTQWTKENACPGREESICHNIPPGQTILWKSGSSSSRLPENRSTCPSWALLLSWRNSPSCKQWWKGHCRNNSLLE